MKVAVVGAGTAGLYCTIELLEALPKFAKVDLVHSKSISPIEVGESSLISFPHALSCGIDYIHHFDSQELGSTIKYGVQFKNWNGVGLIPFASGSYGIQFDTTKFPQFVIPRLHKMYSNFSEKVRTIKEIKSLGRKASLDGEEYDFIVDCRGYPEDYSNYIISDNVYLDSAIAIRSYTPGDWEYTYHIAHKNGWMFGLPLQSRTGWGYLYNSNITSQLEAQDDVAKILEEYQVEFHSKDCREFSFKNYYAKNIMNEDGNIFVNGNRALFLEPIQATSLGCYGLINEMILDRIENDVYDIDKYHNIMNEVIMFINLHYLRGSDYNTPFWRMATRGAEKLFNGVDPSKYNWDYILDWNPQFRRQMFDNFI
tara:strand:+ start:683 stop:1786 length:1104 start_codon:yes stop_codon:yes gene_type:complete